MMTGVVGGDAVVSGDGRGDNAQGMLGDEVEWCWSMQGQWW